jgi:hypothetical protein
MSEDEQFLYQLKQASILAIEGKRLPPFTVTRAG